MILQLDQFKASQRYYLMSQTLVPRPVAWVLSENASGNYNLAPFSYFNAICSAPPLIMLSIGKKPDGSDKDTRRNIIERKHFTVHIASSDSLQALNQSASPLDANDSELDALGLATTAFNGFTLPRLADCKIAYACTLHEVHILGKVEQAVIYGEIRAIHIDDSVASEDAKGRIRVDVEKLQPVSRLGASEYMQPGKVVTLKRYY